MTKTTLFAAGMMVASVALAEGSFNAGIQYKYYAGSNDMPDANAYQVNLGVDILKNLTADIRSEYQDFNDSTVTANRLEVGVTPSYQIPGSQFDLFARLAVGNQWLNTSFVAEDEQTFAYGSIEPGVKYVPWAGHNTQVSLSYRYRGAFEDQPLYNTNAVILSGEYAIDRRNSVVGGYEYVASADDSDLASNVLSVGYLARF